MKRELKLQRYRQPFGYFCPFKLTNCQHIIFTGEKGKTTAVAKKTFFFTTNLSRAGAYVNLYSFERSMKLPFSTIFCFCKQEKPIKNAHYAKNVIGNADLEAICNILVNSYQTNIDKIKICS